MKTNFVINSRNVTFFIRNILYFLFTILQSDLCVLNMMLVHVVMYIIVGRL